MEELTPVEKRQNYYFKREDTYSFAGVSGGKVRTAKLLCQGASGLTTAGSKSSPQIVIISHMAEYYRVPFRGHTASGQLSWELEELKTKKFTDIVQHKYGYNSVIKKRARDDAKERNWKYIPFGMECQEAIDQTANQVKNLPFGEFKRIVVPVGSGMTFCGVVHGVRQMGINVPILVIRVGAYPVARIRKFLPVWYNNWSLLFSELNYNKRKKIVFCDIELDPIYEAKCVSFLKEGDLFWIVGIRKGMKNE